MIPSRARKPKHTANLSGLVLGCIGGEFSKERIFPFWDLPNSIRIKNIYSHTRSICYTDFQQIEYCCSFLQIDFHTARSRQTFRMFVTYNISEISPTSAIFNRNLMALQDIPDGCRKSMPFVVSYIISLLLFLLFSRASVWKVSLRNVNKYLRTFRELSGNVAEINQVSEELKKGSYLSLRTW